MTTATAGQADAPPRAARTRRRTDLGDHVARIVTSLQSQVLRDPPRPDAVSALARLRRSVGRTPGFDYSLDTYLAVPDNLLGFQPADDSQATDAEYAAHDAITLYAVHQQSRSEPMNVGGRGLGTALAGLVRVTAGPEGVRRRFAALGTASTYPEGIHHLRGLITMLREHRIPLDYGLLAGDLQALRRPGNQAAVQAVWGREYFRSRPDQVDDPSSPATDNSEERPA